MKLNLTKYIMCGALAAALATFADNKAQAVVIDDTVFAPISLKLIAYYEDANGKIKKARITAKDVLKTLGYTTKGDQLAYADDDVFVINKTTEVADLSEGNYVVADLNDLVDSETDSDNGGFKDSGAGSFDLSFYSDPQFDGEEDFDQGASEGASDYWFEISGVYTSKVTGGAVKSGDQKISESFTAQLDGQGFDVDVDAMNDLPIAGTASASGSGKVPAL